MSFPMIIMRESGRVLLARDASDLPLRKPFTILDMGLMPTVRQLREEGYKVKVYHYRFPKREDLPRVLKPRNQFGKTDTMDERGGKTVVSITEQGEDGASALGTAVCVNTDCYCKIVGVALAKKRALEELDYFGLRGGSNVEER